MAKKGKEDVSRHLQKLINALLASLVCLAIAAPLLWQAWRHWLWAQEYFNSNVPGRRIFGLEYESFARNYGIAGSAFGVLGLFNALMSWLHWKRYVRSRRLYSKQCAHCGYDPRMCPTPRCPECGHPTDATPTHPLP